MKIRITLLLGCIVAAPAWGQGTLVEVKHDGAVLALAWSADGQRLASGSDDGAIRITDVASGKELTRFTADAAINALVFSPDGKLLGVKSGFMDGPLSVWDIAAKKKLKQLSFKGYSCSQIAFTADGDTLVAAGPGENMIWNHVKGGGSGSRMGKVPEGSAAAVSANGALFAWSNPQGFLTLSHTNPRKQQPMQVGPTVAFAFSADARQVATAGPDKTIRLWLVGGTEQRKFEGLREPAKLVQFSANGKVLAALSAGDPVVRLWDVATGRLRRRLSTSGGERVLALSPDGRTLAVASAAKAQLFNVATRDLGELGKATPLSDAELKGAWDNLASPDHVKSDAAFKQLAVAQEHALPFLKERIRSVAVPKVDWQRVQELLANLDDAAYPVRQRATLELAKHGEVIQVALTKYLAAKPSLEGERRARKLLERIQDVELDPDRLRCLEAIEILEIARARDILEELSRDALLAQVRLSARDALDRVKKGS